MLAALGVVPLLATAAVAEPVVKNLTGLPAYPHLSQARMDSVLRTDGLGRWCRHFSAETSSPLDVVEAWYRSVMVGASETNLAHDSAYQQFASLSGIKLCVGIDSVAVYKATDHAPTSIDLLRCSAG
jgi:hypothetical protein